MASADGQWPAFERAAQMLFLLNCSFFAWLLVCAREVVMQSDAVGALRAGQRVAHGTWPRSRADAGEILMCSALLAAVVGVGADAFGGWALVSGRLGAARACRAVDAPGC